LKVKRVFDKIFIIFLRKIKMSEEQEEILESEEQESLTQQIYRESSLKRISTQEQLNRVIKLNGIHVWLIFAAAALLIAGVVCYFVLGY